MSLILRISVSILFVLILLGCQKPLTQVPPSPEDVITDIRPYFPADPNMNWVYDGEGNEYASFSRHVNSRQDSRAQFIEDNGGTRTAMVYQVRGNEIKRIFLVPEFYTDESVLTEPPNRSEIILKSPLKTGETWQDETSRREVLGIQEKVSVPSGIYQDVVKIKVSPIQGGSQGGIVFEYYAPNTGLILREYISGSDFRVVSKLKYFGKTL